MAVTSGFFNSVGGDRTYNAEQMGSLFDGILNDGIYRTIGDAFVVKPASGRTVTVGTGRGWFLNTWILNDSVLAVDVPSADLLLGRIDTIVIEVNKQDDTRATTIKVVSGTEAADPSRPRLESSTTLKQYPLCDIKLSPGATSVTTSDITNRRGSNACPWVTGPLETVSAQTLYDQWAAEWNNWFDATKEADDERVENWISEKDADFQSWYGGIQSLLTDDQAAYLAAEISKINSMLSGFQDDPTLYDMLLDSDGNPVIDSNSTAIDGRIIYKKA